MPTWAALTALVIASNSAKLRGFSIILTPPFYANLVGTARWGLRTPPRRINEIVHGNRSITVNTALRLSRYFGLSERFWLNLQARYDLEVEKDRLEGQIEREVKVLAVSPVA